MKKFFKILTYCLFLAGLAALIICYIVIPEQTKNAVDVVMDYLNRPLPIIGISIIALGYISYVFFNSTTIGKKGLKKLTNKFEESKKEAEDYLNKGKEQYENAKKCYEETKLLLSAQKTELDLYKNELINICKTIPNAKVNKIADKIEGKSVEIEQELNEQLQNIEMKVENLPIFNEEYIKNIVKKVIEGEKNGEN